MFSFVSLVAFGTSSYSAAYKTYTETLIMDNDAPTGAKYRNPKSTDGHWIYYPKKSWGMNKYLTGSAYYNGDARRGLCSEPTMWLGDMVGGTVYAWEWMGIDNTAPGDPVTLYVKINDSSFTAPAVEYMAWVTIMRFNYKFTESWNGTICYCKWCFFK